MIEFNGGGKTQFSPEKQAIIEKSVAALEAATGLKIEQIQCCPDLICLEMHSPTGQSVAEFEFLLRNDTLFYTVLKTMPIRTLFEQHGIELY